MDYDLIIIGSGAAGMTASIYASRYQLKNLLIGDIQGGTTTEAHKIYNWPGDPGITGNELMAKMAAHVRASGGELMSDTVTEAVKEGEGFAITTARGKHFSCKRLLFTSGTKHRHLGLTREKELSGRGVAYCATCDGPFFKGLKVAVIGGRNSAISAALYLADVAEHVYVVCRAAELNGEPLWQQELISRSNVTVIGSANVVDLKGEMKLEALVLDREVDGSNEVAVDGMFVEIGLLPQTELAKKLGADINELGYIKVAPDMSTNIPGLYAAGDSTDASNNFHQIVTAASEGAVAADAIFKSLSVA